MDEAPLRLDMSMDDFAAKPTFDYAITLRDLGHGPAWTCSSTATWGWMWPAAS